MDRLCYRHLWMELSEPLISTGLYQFYICALPCKNVSLGICWQQRPRSACASVLSDQGLHCPLTKSLGTTESSCLKLDGPGCWYLVCNIILLNITKIVQIKALGSKVTMPQVSLDSRRHIGKNFKNLLRGSGLWYVTSSNGTVPRLSKL